MVFNLVDKAIKLFDSQFHQENLRKVKKSLLDNLYPEKFIGNNIKNRLITLNSDEQPEKTDSISIVISQYNMVTDKISSKLKNFNIKTVNTINNNEHEIDWNRTQIIDREPKLMKRLTSETLHIKNSKISTNLQKDKEQFNNIYLPLMK